MQESPTVKQSQWTPELIIQLVKEFVCAALGIFLVGYTLLMVNNAFGMLDNATKLSNAKDLLLLLFSLTGVVLGYYFGRVPADARTSQALKQATVATAHSSELNNAAKGVGARVNKVKQEMESSNIMHNGQDVTQQMLKDIQDLSEECRKLTDKASMLPA
jgi:hypothetical protein